CVGPRNGPLTACFLNEPVKRQRPSAPVDVWNFAFTALSAERQLILVPATTHSAGGKVWLTEARVSSVSARVIPWAAVKTSPGRRSRNVPFTLAEPLAGTLVDFLNWSRVALSGASSGSQTLPSASPSRFSWPGLATRGQLSTFAHSPSPSTSFWGS